MSNGSEALARYQAVSAGSALPDTRATGKAKLKEVAQEFESILVKQLLDEMRKTLHKENRLFEGGMGEEIFEDMLYTEYSRMFAKAGNFGVAEAIERQYERMTPKAPYAG